MPSESRGCCITCIFYGEISLPLHSGRQLIDAQGQLALKGWHLLAKSRKSSERALASKLFNWRVPAWDGMRIVHLHRGSGIRSGRGGRGWGWGSAARGHWWTNNCLICFSSRSQEKEDLSNVFIQFELIHLRKSKTLLSPLPYFLPIS